MEVPLGVGTMSKSEASAHPSQREVMFAWVWTAMLFYFALHAALN